MSNPCPYLGRSRYKPGDIVAGYQLLRYAKADKWNNRYLDMLCTLCGDIKCLSIYRVAATNKREGCKKCTTEALLLHGESSKQTPTYITWCRMLQRVRNTCNPKDRHIYKNVTCDPRWFDYLNFKSDMGERPANKTLDRIDGKKGYYKENCRWATSKEQANNKIKK